MIISRAGGLYVYRAEAYWTMYLQTALHVQLLGSSDPARRIGNRYSSHAGQLKSHAWEELE
jgi:hypothetical protein